VEKGVSSSIVTSAALHGTYATCFPRRLSTFSTFKDPAALGFSSSASSLCGSSHAAHLLRPYLLHPYNRTRVISTDATMDPARPTRFEKKKNMLPNVPHKQQFHV
jgi:hypothetical protein